MKYTLRFEKIYASFYFFITFRFVDYKISSSMKTKTLLLTVLISLFCGNLFSQEEGTIIYTDFEPDSVIYPVDIEYIDINYDNEWDVKFIREIYGGFGVLECKDYWGVRHLAYNFNDSLSSIKKWSTYVELLTYGNDYHIALLHKVGAECYYGWMKLYVERHDASWHDPSVTITEMAYCTIPNYPLRFGQKSLTEDVAEIDGFNRQYELYPNPADDRLVLKLADEHKCENVSVYSIDGRMLKSQNTDFENIDVSALTRGVYFVRIRLQEGSVFTEKIVIK